MIPIDEKERSVIRGARGGVDPLSSDSHFLGDVNLFVTAGAGSGKTTVLVERMVSLVRVGIPLGQIVAITFTRKAAGELRGRFFFALVETRDRIRTDDDSGDDPKPTAGREEELHRLETAIVSIEAVFIDTIHAFCSRLLRERPFLAGLSPEFGLVKERDRRGQTRSFWRSFVSEAYLKNPTGIDRLREIGIEPDDLLDYFIDRCKFEGVRAPDNRVAEPDLEGAASDTLRYVAAIRAGMPGISPGDALATEIERGVRKERVRGLQSNADRADYLSGLDRLVSEAGDLRDGSIRVTKWGSKKSDPVRQLADSLKSALSSGDLPSVSEFVMSIIRPALMQWRSYIYSEIDRFVDSAVCAFSSHRIREGKLTFDDLLRIAAEMLRHSPEAREWFSRRYRHILVDEFQDTDPRQAEVLFYLTSENRLEKDWSACKPRPGSLFIVGDDKQSIYRFRHADLRVFNACRQQITATGGKEIHLKANFRSLGVLCDWINAALSPLFFTDVDPYQASYEDIVSARKESTQFPAICQIETGPVSRHSPIQIANLDAAHVVLTIQSMVQGTYAELVGATSMGDHPSARGTGATTSYSYGDFMILVRYAKRMHIYAAALEQAGIPYTMSGGKALHRAPILSEIVHLLDAVYDRRDAISRVAYLRGFFSGITDGALYRYRKAGGTFSGAWQVPPELRDEDCIVFSDAFETLDVFSDYLSSYPLSQALELIFSSRGLLASATLQTDGSAQAGAIYRTLSLIREWEADGMGWPDCREELHRLLEGENDADAMTLEAGSKRAVKLLNVHQAKGLESRVVFLADPAGHAGVRDVDAHVDRAESEPRVFIPVRKRFAFGSSILAAPQGWTEAKASEERFELAESMRLLYVAATRAKDVLVISRYTGKEVGVWAPLHKMLDEDGSPVLAVSETTVQNESICADYALLEQAYVQSVNTIREASIPAFVKVRATDREEADVDAPSIPPTFAPEYQVGKGKGFGSAVHRLFEWAVIERDLHVDSDRDKSMATRFLAEEEDWSGSKFSDGVSDMTECLISFRQSDLWNEIIEAEQLLTEVPFSLKRDKKGAIELISGTIDLVFSKNGSWKIVDYKTDASAPDVIVQKYRAQVAEYADAWETLMGTSVNEFGLWWVPKKLWIPLMS